MGFLDCLKRLQNVQREKDDIEKQFKRHMGMTMEEYINHHRIEASKRLLSKEQLKDVPIRVIASEIGYTNPSTFISLFTQKEGMPPDVWRESRESEGADQGT